MPLIIEETVLAKIDEIAGEKHRRAATIEKALREFIEREEKKGRGKPAAETSAAKPMAKSMGKPAAKPIAKPVAKPVAKPIAKAAARPPAKSPAKVGASARR
ncbi:MAG: hypothetical protein H0X08_01905 [Blastocatellia bacterium]|nr:hypothetical protein [Blastocatellia bacterium]